MLFVMNHCTPKNNQRIFSSCLGSRQAALGGMIALAWALLLPLILSPLASAKAPDGIYKFTSGSGEIEIGGKRFDLSRPVLKEIGSVKSGSVTIKNGVMMLDRDAARNILKAILEIVTEIIIKGPASMTFGKSGNSYVAKTQKPVAVNFTSDFSGAELVGVLRSRYDAKVTGGKLVIKVKFDGVIGLVGSIDQPQIAGSASIVCNR